MQMVMERKILRLLLPRAWKGTETTEKGKMKPCY
jgi:hypothetical protein